MPWATLHHIFPFYFYKACVFFQVSTFPPQTEKMKHSASKYLRETEATFKKNKQTKKTTMLTQCTLMLSTLSDSESELVPKALVNHENRVTKK